MKTRVVSLKSGGFVPQRYVSHFLFGGHWDSLYEENGVLRSSASEEVALDRRCETLEEAERIIRRYTSRELDKASLK